MSQEQLDSRLHLPDLWIEGFRRIEALTIERLGRVTLLAGKNSVGKTTVLDAAHVSSTLGHYMLLSELLNSRQEVSTAIGAMAAGIVSSFHERSEAAGEGFFELLLCGSIGSDLDQQDSRTYQPPPRRSPLSRT